MEYKLGYDTTCLESPLYQRVVAVTSLRAPNLGMTDVYGPLDNPNKYFEVVYVVASPGSVCESCRL